MIGGEDTFVQ